MNDPIHRLINLANQLGSIGMLVGATKALHDPRYTNLLLQYVRVKDELAAIAAEFERAP